jgi:uncharacterized membrane protein (UPF0127 family)
MALITFLNLNTKPQNKICIKERCFYVELAVTQQQQERGLMFRRYLDEDKGMLFIFNEESVHPFWMKNVILPLDIIWLNREHEVVFISKNAQPCINDFCEDINPDKNSSYALEFNAGTADEIGLDFGDKIMFDIS